MSGLDWLHVSAPSAKAWEQNHNWSGIARDAGGQKFRVMLHRDATHQFQSHGHVDVWTPDGWETVYHMHASEVTDTDKAAAIGWIRMAQRVTG